MKSYMSGVRQKSPQKTGSPAKRQPISYTFQWNLGGQNVHLYGEFNLWKGQRMKKVLKRDRQEINELNQDSTHFLKISNLERKVYQYKFKVDENWRINKEEPVTNGQDQNNMLDLSSKRSSGMRAAKKLRGTPLEERQIQSELKMQRYISHQTDIIDEESNSCDDQSSGEEALSEGDYQLASSILPAQGRSENSAKEVQRMNHTTPLKNPSQTQITPRSIDQSGVSPRQSPFQIQKLNSLIDLEEQNINFDLAHRIGQDGVSHSDELQPFSRDSNIVLRGPAGPLKSQREVIEGPQCQPMHDSDDSDGVESPPDSLDLSQTGNQQNEQEQNDVIRVVDVDDDEDSQDEEEDLNIDKAAQKLFVNIFQDIFDQVSQTQISSGGIFITQKQYDRTIKIVTTGGDSSPKSITSDQREQIQHFSELYNIADKRGNGRVSREDIIDAIKQDLQVQLVTEQGEESEQSDYHTPTQSPLRKNEHQLKDSIVGSENVLTSPDVVRKMSFKEDMTNVESKTKQRKSRAERRSQKAQSSLANESFVIESNLNLSPEEEEKTTNQSLNISLQMYEKNSNILKQSFRSSMVEQKLEQEKGAQEVELFEHSIRQPHTIKFDDFADQQEQLDFYHVKKPTHIPKKLQKSQETYSEEENESTLVEDLEKQIDATPKIVYDDPEYHKRYQSQNLDKSGTNNLSKKLEESFDIKTRNHDEIFQKRSQMTRSQMSSRQMSHSYYNHLKEGSIQNILSARSRGLSDEQESLLNKDLRTYEEEEKLIINQSVMIFNEIFLAYFQQNELCDEPELVITFDQFTKAVNATTDNRKQSQEERDQLVLLFQAADMKAKGYLTKQQLLNAIQEDIREGQSKSETGTNISIVEQKVREEVLKMNSGEKVRAKAKTAQTFTPRAVAARDEIYGGMDLPIHLLESGGIINNCYDPKEDPILKTLAESNLKKRKAKDEDDTQHGHLKCQNLCQAIDYIEKYKLSQYSTSHESLKYLFKILHESSLQVQTEYERAARLLKEKNQYQDLNREMEGHIDQLECEIENLRAYETSYYREQKKLEFAVEQNDELEIERDNLQSVYRDLIKDFDQIKQKSEHQTLEGRSDKHKILELQTQISSLKDQILQGYHARASNNEEEAQELLNAEGQTTQQQQQIAEEEEETDVLIEADETSDYIGNENEGNTGCSTGMLKGQIGRSRNSSHSSNDSKVLGAQEASQSSEDVQRVHKIDLSSHLSQGDADSENCDHPGFTNSREGTTNKRIESGQVHPGSRSQTPLELIQKTNLSEHRTISVAAGSRQLSFVNPLQRIHGKKTTRKVITNYEQSWVESEGYNESRLSLGDDAYFQADKSPMNQQEDDISMVKKRLGATGTKVNFKHPAFSEAGRSGFTNLESSLKTNPEEQQILEDLETTEVFQMRTKIINYINNNVQLERQGLNLQVKALKSGQRQQTAIIQKLKFNILELQGQIRTRSLAQDDVTKCFNDKQMEISGLKENVLEIMEENQRLQDEKQRLVGVNGLLEQKIKVDQSERMTIMSEADNMQRHMYDQQSNRSGASKFSMTKMSMRMGTRLSTYKQSIASQGGQQNQFMTLGARRSTVKFDNPHQSAMKLALPEEDGLSIQSRSALWMKNQTRIRNDEQSDFRSNRSFMERSLNMSGSVMHRINDDESETSVRRMSNYEGSETSSQRVYKKKQGGVKKFGLNRGMSTQQSIRSLKSAASKSVVSLKDSEGGRVQVISDFGSEETHSIDDLVDQQEIDSINKNIKEYQDEELHKKRESHEYDQLGLANPEHHWHELIQQVITQEEKTSKLQPTPQISLETQKQFYSETVRIYYQRQLTEVVMFIYQGVIYFLLKDPKTKSIKLDTLVKPFNFLNDVSKVVFSNRFRNYLAIKLRDMRKFGDRDHVIFELKDRELLADFMMEYAFDEEDDMIFEQNEEFSVIVNSSPVWFSFDEIEKYKQQEQRLVRTGQAQDLTGFLEVKENNAMNILKNLFKKSSQLNQINWSRKYVALKGLKMFIYDGDGQKFTKPEKVINMTQEMAFMELHQADADGKENAFSFKHFTNQQVLGETIIFAAPSEINMNKWIKRFQTIKSELDELKLTNDLIQKGVLKSPQGKGKNIANFPSVFEDKQKQQKNVVGKKSQVIGERTASVVSFDPFNFQHMQQNDGHKGMTARIVEHGSAIHKQKSCVENRQSDIQQQNSPTSRQAIQSQANSPSQNNRFSTLDTGRHAGQGSTPKQEDEIMKFTPSPQTPLDDNTDQRRNQPPLDISQFNPSAVEKMIKKNLNVHRTQGIRKSYMAQNIVPLEAIKMVKNNSKKSKQVKEYSDVHSNYSNNM